MAVRPHSETLGPVIPRSGAGAWCVVCGCVGVFGRGPGTRGRVHNIAAFLLPPLHTVYISISTSTHTSHRLHLYSVYTLLQAALQQTHDSPIHGLVLMFTINYVCLQTKHAAGVARACALQTAIFSVLFKSCHNYYIYNNLQLCR